MGISGRSKLEITHTREGISDLKASSSRSGRGARRGGRRRRSPTSPQGVGPGGGWDRPAAGAGGASEPRRPCAGPGAADHMNWRSGPGRSPMAVSERSWPSPQRSAWPSRSILR